MPDERKEHSEHVILLLVLVMAVAIVAVIFSVKLFSHEEDVYNLTTKAMNTYVRQTTYGQNAIESAKLTAERIEKLEEELAFYKENSQIYNINLNSGKKWIDISPAVLDIIKKSLEISKLSRGTFEPTILPVARLWNFKDKSNIIPERQDIIKNLNLTDYNIVKINEEVKRILLLKENSGLDLTGIIKGIACNFAVKQYKLNGIRAGIISVGQSIAVYGNKKDNKPWEIALKNPFEQKESTSFGNLSIKDGHVSTSCIFNNFFKKEENIYHHVIDPSTGYPVKNNLISVTVTHADGLIADALSTACLVLDKENSSGILNHYAAGAIFLDNNKNIFITENLKDKFILENKDFKIIN